MKFLTNEHLLKLAEQCHHVNPDEAFDSSNLILEKDLFLMDVQSPRDKQKWGFVTYAVCLGYESSFCPAELKNLLKDDKASLIKMHVLLLGQMPPKQVEYNITGKSMATGYFTTPEGRVIRFTKVNIKSGVDNECW